ncbi:hypothetical protein [Synechococcus phage MinM1]|nr:hypothetical protein [Synechococcus phage MinM1]
MSPSDLFGDLESAFARQPRTDQPRLHRLPGAEALAALAIAFGHDHALSYPRRRDAQDPDRAWTPHEAWLRRYAETHGAHQARRFREALHRLPPELRAAIANDLLPETPHG